MASGLPGGALVIGDTVYGHLRTYRSGILLQGATAEDNVLHDNYVGIEDRGQDLIQGNRAYHNTTVGILGGGIVEANVIYCNPIGAKPNINFSSGGNYVNNVIYANTNIALLLSGSRKIQAVNNTIFQPTGNASLFVSDTVLADNGNATTVGNIVVAPTGNAAVNVSLGPDRFPLVGAVWLAEGTRLAYLRHDPVAAVAGGSGDCVSREGRCV